MTEEELFLEWHKDLKDFALKQNCYWLIGDDLEQYRIGFENGNTVEEEYLYQFNREKY